MDNIELQILYDDALKRMVEMNFTVNELDYIFTDWDGGKEYFLWLLIHQKLQELLVQTFFLKRQVIFEIK